MRKPLSTSVPLCQKIISFSTSKPYLSIAAIVTVISLPSPRFSGKSTDITLFSKVYVNPASPETEIVIDIDGDFVSPKMTEKVVHFKHNYSGMSYKDNAVILTK